MWVEALSTPYKAQQFRGNIFSGLENKVLFLGREGGCLLWSSLFDTAFSGFKDHNSTMASETVLGGILFIISLSCLHISLKNISNWMFCFRTKNANKMPALKCLLGKVRFVHLCLCHLLFLCWFILKDTGPTYHFHWSL